jgi:hypothetical protein
MTTLQAMLLGAMIVLTPSLLVLAFILRGIPDAPGEDPDWLEVDPSEHRADVPARPKFDAERTRGAVKRD